METNMHKTSNIHSIQIRLSHLLAVVFLSSHFVMFVSAKLDSKELFGGATSPLQAEENFLNEVAMSNIMGEVKRSWKSLQGSWGKRSDEKTVGDGYDTKPGQTAMSPSGYSHSEQQILPEAIRYYVVYESRPNIRSKAVGSDLLTELDNIKEGTTSNVEKKNWKNINVAWGKRRSAVWNKFRGAWGKREPAWNNLKGMWGKRSPNDWRKLQSSWGKRSQQN